MLIVCIKTPAIFKYQRFDNSDSGETTIIVYNCQQFDERDIEEKQSLDKYYSNGNYDRYIFFLFPKKSQTAWPT